MLGGVLPCGCSLSERSGQYLGMCEPAHGAEAKQKEKTKKAITRCRLTMHSLSIQCVGYNKRCIMSTSKDFVKL